MNEGLTPIQITLLIPCHSNIKVSQNTVKGLKNVLSEPLLNQYFDFYKGNSLEQLRVDLEGVDEADTGRRKALEAMILLREQESGLIGMQREQAEAVLALEKERSQLLLNRFENTRTEAQNQTQIGESQSFNKIIQGQLKGEIRPSQVDRLRAEVSLETAKKNQKLAQEQLATLRGSITAKNIVKSKKDKTKSLSHRQRLVSGKSTDRKTEITPKAKRELNFAFSWLMLLLTSVIRYSV